MKSKRRQSKLDMFTLGKRSLQVEGEREPNTIFSI